MKTRVPFAVCTLLVAAGVFAAGGGKPVSPTNRAEARAALIPYPQKVEWKSGSADLRRYRIVANREEEKNAGVLRQVLDAVGGKPDGRKGIPIQLSIDPGIGNDEGYHLAVDKNGVAIKAATETGLFYGIQTLRQLAGNDLSAIPCCRIEDRPAFKWRGFMHDLGRNPQDLDTLKRFMDVMANYKMNIFHMHLADNPGYRIESIAHPELNDPKNYRQTRRPGFFYTYDELNEFIAYCRERHIRVVPEIDMPGHSGYFERAFGVEMQDPEGTAIVHDLLNEFCDHVDVPVIHIGADEVHIKNKDFIPGVCRLLESRGKRVVMWRPGAPVPSTNVITQIWILKNNPPLEKNPYLDSDCNYINHMDALVGPVRVFMQQPCRERQGSDRALGGILCHWPDNNPGEEINIYRQSPVFPALLAYSERIWRGAQNNRADCWAGLPASDDPAFREYAAFEKDLIVHRDLYLKDWPFPYVRQTDMVWKLIGPFDHKGDTKAVFPVERSIQPEYTVDGKTYQWDPREHRGGTLHINHFFGYPAHLPTCPPGTVYALTHIVSPKDQTVGFWIGFNGQSRSGGRHSGSNPRQGQWSICNAGVWVNGEAVPPPKWKNPGLGRKTPEIPFADENYWFRKPVEIHLKKGRNTVLVKIPHDQTERKWMFTFVPVVWNGQHFQRVENFTFSVN